MATSDELILNDRNIYPSEELLFSIFGDRKIVWQKILNYAHDHYNNITEEWRYYNDGKQWLFKLQYKKKTVFWAGVLKDTFRITFYMGGQAENLIRNSNLSEDFKREYSDKKQSGKFYPVTVRITGPENIEDIFKMIDLKISQK